jgi:hypothetical protein
MDIIYTDAWNGKLDTKRLEQFLSSSPGAVNSISGTKSTTLLCAVVRAGQLDLVRLLLDNPYAQANPNVPDSRGRYPLYYATTRVPLRDRNAIVRTLINSGADINTCSTDSDDNTPLMNAVVQVKDEITVWELIDHGADTHIERNGHTAISLARGTPLAGALLPKNQRRLSYRSAVVGLVATVNVVFGYVNAIAGGALKRLFGIGGVKVLAEVCTCCYFLWAPC